LLVSTDVTGPVATLTLDSPDNRNALSVELMGQLTAGLTAAIADDSVRVVVLSHTGRVFCSGMDLKSPNVSALPDLLQAILDCPKPVIARVGGPARAGGIGLLAACDIAVAADTATFAFSEVRLGLVPAVISATVLPLLSRTTARELFLTGEVFDGNRAAEIGLVTTAVSDVDSEVARYAELLVRGGPNALAETKRLLRNDFSRDQLTEMSARLFASAEGQEGIAAFREKRSPYWISTG
jgi:methylglutaconyl-CoA hydratase